MAHFFGKQKYQGAFRHLIQGLNEPQGKLRELHHGPGHVTEKHQILSGDFVFFLIAEPGKAAAGFQPLSDGTAEVSWLL